MPLIVDGHNLIGQMRDISLTDPDDEAQLVERLAAYRRRRRAEITVVFDPSPDGGPPLEETLQQGGVRVIYARPGQRADEVICRLVRRARDRRSLTVISSDRAVQAEARYLGARVIPAHEFARRLRPPRRREPGRKELPPSPQEVEEWLRLFERRRQPPGDSEDQGHTPPR